MKRASFLTRLQFSYTAAVLRNLFSVAGKAAPAVAGKAAPAAAGPMPQLRRAVRG